MDCGALALPRFTAQRSGEDEDEAAPDERGRESLHPRGDEDDDPTVRRRACEAFVRSGIEPPVESSIWFMSEMDTMVNTVAPRQTRMCVRSPADCCESSRSIPTTDPRIRAMNNRRMASFRLSSMG